MKKSDPFCLVVTRYMIGGGKRGNVGGTHGEAVLNPFAPRGPSINYYSATAGSSFRREKRARILSFVMYHHDKTATATTMPVQTV